MLIVFGGLPGTGKTTIARRIAAHGAATYLRIDAIEQAMRDAGVPADGIGEAGYAVANAIAEANLLDGRTVVADCVNPVPESREAWRVVASEARVPLVEVEIICTDEVEHRRRVEERVSDIPGLVLPRWRDVFEHTYHPWHDPHVIIDTAGLTPDQAIALVTALALPDRGTISDSPFGSGIPPRIETERLVLDGHRSEDLDPLAAMWADACVVRHVGGRASTRQESWFRLLRYRGLWPVLGYGYWAVRERQSGRFVGDVGFADFKSGAEPSIDGRIEAGWVLAGWTHGRDYATEAMAAALHWLDSATPHRSVVCLVDASNVASLRVAEKCGFSRIGSARIGAAESILLDRTS